MTDTHCAKPPVPHQAVPHRCAILLLGPNPREERSPALRDSRSALLMTFADRSTPSLRATLAFLFFLSAPNLVRCGQLDDAAHDLARKIAVVIPAHANVSYEIRNSSSLRPDDVAKIGQEITTDLQARGFSVSAAGDAQIKLIVTLSESWRDFVWIASILGADTSENVIVAVPRLAAESASGSAMRATLRAEKFWEGPERILDAVQGTGPDGRTTITVLLLADKLEVQEPAGKFEVPVARPLARDPIGKLSSVEVGAPTWFLGPQGLCKVDLDMRGSPECPANDGIDAPITGRYPMMLDLRPGGPGPAGKGMELTVSTACGGSSQFLATSDRDDTQTDTVQVFETETSGPVAISAELDFPGPVLALHSAPDASRAVVRNLTTGNYEAYRLSVSCGK
jgi:hypothetical protein